MSILQSVRGRLTLIKGSLLTLLIVGIFAMINYNARNFVNTATGTKRYYRQPVDEGPDTQPPRHWSYKYPHNPCYEKDDDLFCGPALYLMGIQNAGLDLLKQAIGLHPNVDCYSTGFFANFSNIKDIKRSDMGNYVRSFEVSADKIQNGYDQLCICDSGRDLARTYDLEISDSVVSPPDYTTAAALANLFGYMKIIVILRDPTVRFVQEYCALGIATPFDEYVDDAISGFLDCENNVTRDNESCVYDASLSGLLQAGLYDYLIENDIARSFDEYSYKLLTCDDLVNTDTRRSIMMSIFNYLEKDVPDTLDPYWYALNALFVPKTGDCHGQTITGAAKQKLKDFYRARATFAVDIS